MASLTAAAAAPTRNQPDARFLNAKLRENIASLSRAAQSDDVRLVGRVLRVRPFSSFVSCPSLLSMSAAAAAGASACENLKFHSFP